MTQSVHLCLDIAVASYQIGIQLFTGRLPIEFFHPQLSAE